MRALAIVVVLLGIVACRGPAGLRVKTGATKPAAETVTNITGTDHRGVEFSLKQALDDGPVVVIFYRGHW